MIVVRFKVQCQPDRTEEVVTAMQGVVGTARSLPGVIHFDIARDLTDSNALIATEVFQDSEAMEREESLPEVAKVVELMQGERWPGRRSGHGSRSLRRNHRQCSAAFNAETARTHRERRHVLNGVPGRQRRHGRANQQSDRLRGPIWGTTPSCCSMASIPCSDQCSTALPLRATPMFALRVSMCLPVAGKPNASPVWVP